MKSKYISVNVLEEFKDLKNVVLLNDILKREKWKLLKFQDEYTKDIYYQLYFGKGIQIDNTFEYGFPHLLDREDTYKELERFINYRMERENLSTKYRYYVYDFLIGQQLLTVDICDKRFRIDSFNIYGQCSTLKKDWNKITNATISKAYRREKNNNFVIDSYILKHFSEDKYYSDYNDNKLLFKSNDYDDCILFLTKYGKENHNYSYKEEFEYYKDYLIDKSKNIDNLSVDEVPNNLEDDKEIEYE